MTCGGCAPLSLPIIERSLLPLPGHLWLKGERELNSVEWCQQIGIMLHGMSVWEVCCNKCEYHRSGCVGPIVLCQGTVKIQIFANARPFSSMFRMVMQADETAVPGVQECCSQEGWSCVDVPSVVDQFNLLMKVYWG